MPELEELALGEGVMVTVWRGVPDTDFEIVPVRENRGEREAPPPVCEP